MRAAEQAKIELSDHPFAWVREEYLSEKNGIPLHLEIEVSRDDFEALIDDLLAQTVQSIEQVLHDAQVDKEEIDHVLLVGGSTRIPAVWELVTDKVGIEPQMSINPDEAVALGAAVQAAIIAGEPIDAILVDVTPHSLGIAVAEFRMGQLITDRYKVLIHRNTTIPVSKEDIFYTLHPDQNTIKIQVYQGEESVASRNRLLGDFLITDLEAEFPGEPAQVTVRFDLNLDGILKVTARDRHTAKEEDITVEASLERRDEAQILAAQEQLQQQTTTAPLAGELHIPVQRAQRLLMRPDLDQNVLDDLTSLLADIQIAQANNNHDRLHELCETLLDFLFDYE